MEHRLHGSGISESEMVDEFEEPNQPRASHGEVDQGTEADMTSYVEPAPYAARLRMIILLSLACWAALIAGAALVFG